MLQRREVRERMESSSVQGLSLHLEKRLERRGMLIEFCCAIFAVMVGKIVEIVDLKAVQSKNARYNFS